MRVLVTGGTGVVGRPAVDELLRRGHAVRILSRHAERDSGEWSGRVEPFEAHVADAASLQGAAEGCGAVLHIAGIVAEDPPENTFERVNVDGTHNLLLEAARRRVPRFVYISSLGADRGTSDYHRSKKAGEDLVRAYPGSWLILRPGNVYGPGEGVVSLLLKMVRALPAVPVVGTGDQAFQPVWAEDVALALAEAVEQERSGQALDLAGEEVVTMNELLDRLDALTGRRPARVPLPEQVVELGTGAAEALGLDPPVHSDQLVMLREGNLIKPGRPNALTEVFGIRPTPLAEGLARLADGLPEQSPLDGTGPFRRHRYWAEIEGSALDAEGLIRLVRTDFGSLADPQLVRVGSEPGTGAAIDKGATLTLEIPLRGNIQVRVEEVKPREITAATLEGHPLSGMIRFLGDDLPSGLVHFEVRTYTRPSSAVDGLAMALFGDAMKGAAWSSVVDGVIRRSGGRAPEGVQSTAETLDESAMEEVQEWMEGLTTRRSGLGDGGQG